MSGITSDAEFKHCFSTPFTSAHELFSGCLSEDVKNSDTYVESSSQIPFHQTYTETFQWHDT